MSYSTKHKTHVSGQAPFSKGKLQAAHYGSRSHARTSVRRHAHRGSARFASHSLPHVETEFAWESRGEGDKTIIILPWSASTARSRRRHSSLPSRRLNAAVSTSTFPDAATCLPGRQPPTESSTRSYFSYGGYLAAGLARRQPEAFDGLILACTAFRIHPEDRKLPATATVSPRWLPSVSAEFRDHLAAALGTPWEAVARDIDTRLLISRRQTTPTSRSSESRAIRSATRTRRSYTTDQSRSSWDAKTASPATRANSAHSTRTPPQPSPCSTTRATTFPSSGRSRSKRRYGNGLPAFRSTSRHLNNASRAPSPPPVLMSRRPRRETAITTLARRRTGLEPRFGGRRRAAPHSLTS
jgi:pimeloyl-ACP methyl ester carboxylesterase